MQFSSSTSQQNVVLSASTRSQTYLLFTLAMALTFTGVFLGMNFVQALLGTGMHVFFVLAELALIFTAPWWSRSSPLNVLLFALFPLLSGITVTPYILMVLAQFVNGPAILLNATAATVFIALSAVVLARLAPGLGTWARAFFFALLGLLFLSILQIFFAALRTPGFELLISGAAIVIFGFFTAFDIQRIERQSRIGANPFLLALSLYLDIFNLFLAVLRFMSTLSGRRR